MTSISQAELTDLTAEIVGAYVAGNRVASGDLPSLMQSVHGALASLGQEVSTKAVVGTLTPAVPIKKSITDDYLISLEDGRKLKSLKRYLGKLGMTPAQYRVKWGLPADYPMVAPNYTLARSALAKSMGLGRKAVRGAA